MTAIDVNTLPDDAATLKALLRTTIVERDAMVVERDALRARVVSKPSRSATRSARS